MLNPCGKNPELHKHNDHQVDTALNGDWQDCEQTMMWKTPRQTDNEDCYLCMLHLHNRFLTVTSSAVNGLGLLDMSSVVTLNVVFYDCMVTWYRGLSTIQRDDTNNATSTSIFTLGTSVSTLATSELATSTCTLSLIMIKSVRFDFCFSFIPYIIKKYTF